MFLRRDSKIFFKIFFKFSDGPTKISIEFLQNFFTVRTKFYSQNIIKFVRNSEKL